MSDLEVVGGFPLLLQSTQIHMHHMLYFCTVSFSFRSVEKYILHVSIKAIVHNYCCTDNIPAEERLTVIMHEEKCMTEGNLTDFSSEPGLIFSLLNRISGGENNKSADNQEGRLTADILLSDAPSAAQPLIGLGSCCLIFEYMCCSLSGLKRNQTR